jgi:MoxR-like ATPase
VDRFMLKRLLIIQNGWRAFSHSSKSKRKLWESKSSGFSRTNLRAQEAVREVYMDEKIEKYILISFATRYPEKYKLAELKPLISFVSTWKYQFSCCC